MPIPFNLAVRAAVAAASALALLACDKAQQPDAYGHLEATETIVSAQSTGQLERFTPVEGARIAAGAAAAVVDTSALVLQLRQTAAQRSASSARVTEVAHQIEVFDVQATIAERSLARARRLFAQQAGTAQQLDQAERDYRTLVAQRAGARAQRDVAMRDVSSAEAQVAQIRDQIRKNHVASPVGGTVLTTYVRAGEFVQAGQPLFKVADLDTMELRAYVTESQLSSVKIGQRARVSVDAREGRRALTGVIIWVSTQAEFTPTPIQTRDERTNLVYAMKLRVPNPDGALKIGMPADVEFTSSTASR
jgi:HlyD family secretion protein